MLSLHLPVHPNLDQLRHQAKDLLREIHSGQASAMEEFHVLFPDVDAKDAKLSQAQHLLARMYGNPSWPRLAMACKMIDAIRANDLETVRTMIETQPKLLHEMARGTDKCNWGPPMSYAANLGRDELIKMLHNMGAKDHGYAIDRATLQGKTDTARLLHAMMGQPTLPDDCLGGAAYTLSVSGTELMLELGAKIYDSSGKRLAPVDVVLESDSRKPTAKHRILQLYVQHGLVLPDTPTMALHQGRIDLLEEHLRRDPHMLKRTFTHEEIYPPELGCHDEVTATQGTPLAGTTLLHICADYDEFEIAQWLIANGANVNTKAEVNDQGFGGHTALFNVIVSQPAFWMHLHGRPRDTRFAELLLKNGADVTVRASVRKQLHPGYGPEKDTSVHEYRNITAYEWGEQFHDKDFVNDAAMELIIPPLPPAAP